jgi:hypothetical protein
LGCIFPKRGASICNRNRIITGVRLLFRFTLRRLDLAATVGSAVSDDRRKCGYFGRANVPTFGTINSYPTSFLSLLP